MTYPSVVKYVLIGKESTWGTAVTADKDCGLIITDVSTPINREIITSAGISDIEDAAINSGNQDVGCSISGDFQHGRLLEYIIGSVAHVETTGDWKHTFSVSNTPPSATIEVGNNSTVDTVNVLEGMLIESAEFSLALNENLKLSVELKGEDFNPSATASSAVTSALTVYPHQLGSITINGVAATEIQNVTISIPKIVERSGGIGSVIPQQGHATSIKFEYAVTAGFADKTLHDLFKADTSHEFILNVNNGVTLGSGRREFNITLENSKQPSFNEVTSVGGLTFLEISGVGTLKANECYSVDNISSANW